MYFASSKINSGILDSSYTVVSYFKEQLDSRINNIGKIFEFAKQNMRTQENYNKIEEITNLVKKDFENIL